ADAAVAEGTRAELAAPLHPADDAARRQLIRDARDQFVLARDLFGGQSIFQRDADQLACIDGRTPVGMSGHLTVRLREMNPVRVERGAERTTRIARRRGHIHIVESGLAENARVGDAVERDAAAVTEIAQSSLALQRGS